MKGNLPKVSGDQTGPTREKDHGSMDAFQRCGTGVDPRTLFSGTFSFSNPVSFRSCGSTFQTTVCRDVERPTRVIVVLLTGRHLAGGKCTYVILSVWRLSQDNA